MNQKTAKLLLKIMMWSACAFHLVVGAGLNLFPGLPEVMARFYGAEVDFTPQFSYILKPLGAFMLALGVLAISAAREPSKYRVIIYGFVLLFVIRALQRLVHAEALAEDFGISGSRNAANAAFFFALATVLVVLDRLANRTAAPPAEGTGG